MSERVEYRVATREGMALCSPRDSRESAELFVRFNGGDAVIQTRTVTVVQTPWVVEESAISSVLGGQS